MSKKKTKKPPPPPILEDSELPAIPPNWKWAVLGDITTRVTDGTHQTPKFVESGIPFLFVRHIVGGKITFNNTKFIDEETYEKLNSRCPVELGDVLYTAVGSYGVAVPVRTDTPFSFQRHIAHVKPVKEVDTGFVVYALNSPICVMQAHKTARGVAQKTVTLGDLSRFHIPVAPPKEQKRIVSKIEELFSDLDAGVAALTRARANLRRYRASILKSAVEGSLTQKWRVKNPSVEPASELLARILRERRQRWEQQQLATYESKGKKPPKNWQSKYKEPAAPDTANLPELPNGWCWASVSQCSTFESNAITDGPFGSNLKTEHYTDEGPQVIRLNNIGEGEFKDKKKAHISSEHFAKLLKHSVNAGDLVVAMLGETLPRACIVPDYVPPAIVKADCARFATHREILQPSYANVVLNAWSTQKRASKLIAGVGRPRLNLTKVRSLPIPLAPFVEQTKIVYQVGKAIATIESTDSTVAAKLDESEMLRQSILKFAFEGKLMPTGSNLLEEAIG